LISDQQAGLRTEIAIYDWTANSFASTREIRPVQLLIIEGVGSCNVLLREKLTTSIWLDIEQSVGLARVLERDGIAIADQMVNWQKMESEYFARDLTRESGEFILSTQ